MCRSISLKCFPSPLGFSMLYIPPRIPCGPYSLPEGVLGAALGCRADYGRAPSSVNARSRSISLIAIPARAGPGGEHQFAPPGNGTCDLAVESLTLYRKRYPGDAPDPASSPYRPPLPALSASDSSHHGRAPYKTLLNFHWKKGFL